MALDIVVGSRVEARGLTWDVVEIVPLGSQTLLRLRCVAGDLSGVEWQMLHPAETLVPAHMEFRPDAPGPLAAWRTYHEALLLDQAHGADDLAWLQPGRIAIEPYQLVPLMRALELPRPRLLLADGVGLGKTIEAALIACELIVRRRSHRVLVVTPAGPLLTQWMQEFHQRFGLRFIAIADAAALQQQRRKLELGGNPFDATALCLTSLDFAKQERVLEELERSSWDLAIIDEAHHCIASSGAEGDDTQRRRLAEVVARRSDGLLLLTATPHDGSDAHFASLLELLDPSLVDGRGGVVGKAYRRHIVRRLKSQVRTTATGTQLFPARRVVPVRVVVKNAALRRFHEALAALVVPRLRRATRTGGRQLDALAFISVLKRSVSTIGACVATLKVVAARYGRPDTDALRRERERNLRTYRRRLRRFGVLDQAAECDVAELEADGMAADLQAFGAAELATLTRTPPDLDALLALIRLGELAEPFDPKLRGIIDEVASIRAARPGANILIYTEYADSQLAAQHMLERSIDGEVLTINGSDDEAQRLRITDRFTELDDLLLISTDTLAEGLNLQQRCCDLLHLDLPYNPNRLEQRNGRIDRYGQQREPTIRYLYLAGTFEERLLLRLIAKYEKARTQLDLMPDTLGATADEAVHNSPLMSGFAERQASLFEDEASPIRLLDRVAEDANADAYRDLLHEIDRAFAGFDYSALRHGWMAGSEVAPVVHSATVYSIDLPRFVATVAGGDPTEQGVLRLPAHWMGGAVDLPGLDRAAGTLRFTREQGVLRDGNGNSVAFLGSAHAVVRRAVSSALGVSDRPYDARVSVAKADGDVPLAVLLTYRGELRCGPRVELQRTLGIWLPIRGDPLEIGEPARWLCFAEGENVLDAGGVWHRWFAHWLPRRRKRAEAKAMAAMQRMVGQLGAAYGDRVSAERRDLCHWLQDRANTVCGKFVSRTGELFGEVQQRPPWQMMSAPMDRLASYAGDSNNPSARRREAASAIELFQRRDRETTSRASIAPPTVRETGMLMLLPPDLTK